MKSVKRICLIGLCVLLIFTLCACQKEQDDLNVKTGYLAGGTIPESAKLYPIVYNDLPMTIVNPENALAADDVWTLTHYVDVWSTCDDTRGNGFLSEEAAEFVSMERIQKILENNKATDRDYSIDAVQILAMEALDDQRVQVTYVVKFTGQCPSENLKEDTYESIEGLAFKKINGKWYEDGIGFAFMAKAGTITYQLDDITGTYTITPPKDRIQ